MKYEKHLINFQKFKSSLVPANELANQVPVGLAKCSYNYLKLAELLKNLKFKFNVINECIAWPC